MPKPTIADELDIWNYKSYDDIPPAKRAWITIKAKQQGKDPKMVHAGIKAKMARGKKANSKSQFIEALDPLILAIDRAADLNRPGIFDQILRVILLHFTILILFAAKQHQTGI